MYSNHLAKKRNTKKITSNSEASFFSLPGSGSETSQVTFRLVWPVWAPATPTHPKVDQKPKASVAWSRWKLRPKFCETLSRTLGYPTNMHRHLQIQAATSLVAVAHGQPFPRLNSGNGIHGYGPWHGHVLTFLVPFKLTICGPVDLSYLSPDII